MALALGISQTLADNWLKTVRGGGAGTTYTAEAAMYVKLHTGIPGSDATQNVSSVTTRPAITFGAPASGGTGLWTMTQNGTAPAWSNWAGTNNETVSHISIWNASTAGTFLWAAALTTPKTIGTGDTFTLSTSSITFSIATT